MQTIHKYLLAGKGLNVLSIPGNARVLSVGFQNSGPANPDRANLFLWAEVDTEQPEEQRGFWVGETGKELPVPYMMPVGRAENDQRFGPYVVHVFEMAQERHVSRGGRGGDAVAIGKGSIATGGAGGRG